MRRLLDWWAGLLSGSTIILSGSTIILGGYIIIWAGISGWNNLAGSSQFQGLYRKKLC